MRTCMTMPLSYTETRSTKTGAFAASSGSDFHDEETKSQKFRWKKAKKRAALPRSARGYQTRGQWASTPTHPLADDSARRPESTPAAAVRRGPGNYAGARAAEKGLHRSRAQP